MSHHYLTSLSNDALQNCLDQCGFEQGFPQQVQRQLIVTESNCNSSSEEEMESLEVQIVKEIPAPSTNSCAARTPSPAETIVIDCRPYQSPSSSEGKVVEVSTSTSNCRNQAPVPVSVIRQCIACLVSKTKTEDVFTGSFVKAEIRILLDHLDVPIRGNASNTGLCYDCMNQLQRWHIFHKTRRSFLDKNPPKEVEGLAVPSSSRKLTKLMSDTQRKVLEVQLIYEKSEYQYNVIRSWSETDLEFLSYTICKAQSIKAPSLDELELYFSNQDKLLKIFCCICLRLITGGLSGYKRHMAEKHQQDPTFFPCDICGESFPEKEFAGLVDDYFTHWLRHFFLFRCEECDLNLPTSAELTEHKNIHNENEAFETITSPVSAVLFEPKLKSSQILGRSDDGQYECNGLPCAEVEKQTIVFVKCNVCGERLPQLSLRMHQIRHHAKNGHNKTQKSVVKAANNANLKKSMKTANKANLKKSMKTANSANLKKSMKTANNATLKSMKAAKIAKVSNNFTNNFTRKGLRHRYQCRFCEQTFYRLDYRDNHVNFAHLKIANYVCSICDKSFINYCGLKNHERVHVMNYPNFECVSCFKKFFNDQSLRLHKCMGIATDESFQCEFCSMMFKLLKSYTDHLKIHTNVLPHKCGICSQAFRRGLELAVHKQLVHGVVDERIPIVKPKKVYRATLPKVISDSKNPSTGLPTNCQRDNGQSASEWNEEEDPFALPNYSEDNF